jgi:hypothetical protein
LEKDVPKVGLERRMQVNLGLLDGHKEAFGSISRDKHRQYLAYADTNVPVAHRSTRTLIDEHEILQPFSPCLK